jgi:tetratricopeptide (TPR) repeat protein
MRRIGQVVRAGFIITTSLVGAAGIMGQAASPQQQQPQQPASGAPATDKPAAPQAAPLTLEPAAPPVNAEEDAALKAFREMKNDDLAKKEQAAEDFLTKYPQSRYRPEFYAWQVQYFRSKGETEKMEAAADKQLALYPNDPQTLAVVGATLPRAMNANTPDPAKRLAKAEQYCQKALELLPTIVKPEGISDQIFQNAKDQTAAMAYSGLGTVDFRRGKYADAIPNFEKAVRIDPDPDPVNYYLLGYCNQKTAHFDDAVAAYTKCAAIPSGMQATCSQGAEEAKKLAATQLSAPK